MVRPATLRPQCVSCTRDCTTAVYGRLPVCGSDGRSYNNWCELRRRMCRQGVVIITEHGGRCGGELIRRKNSPPVENSPFLRRSFRVKRADQPSVAEIIKRRTVDVNRNGCVSQRKILCTESLFALVGAGLHY